MYIYTYGNNLGSPHLFFRVIYRSSNVYIDIYVFVWMYRGRERTREFACVYVYKYECVCVCWYVIQICIYSIQSSSPMYI